MDYSDQGEKSGQIVRGIGERDSEIEKEEIDMVKWRLLSNSISGTKTAAGHFAKGYRGKRFGSAGKPRGTVKVGRVGRYWGVFDINPHPQVHVITIVQGIKQGKRWFK